MECNRTIIQRRIHSVITSLLLQVKHYGNNLKIKLGKYCIYGGEMANNDQYIDGDDVTAVFNASRNIWLCYQDVTGDDYVDGDDVTLL